MKDLKSLSLDPTPVLNKKRSNAFDPFKALKDGDYDIIPIEATQSTESSIEERIGKFLNEERVFTV